MDVYASSSEAEGLAVLMGLGAGIVVGLVVVGLACYSIKSIGRMKVLEKMGRNKVAGWVPFWCDWELAQGSVRDQRVAAVVVVVGVAAAVATGASQSNGSWIFGLVSILHLACQAYLCYCVSLRMGGGAAQAVGLFLIPVVFWPLLGLGRAECDEGAEVPNVLSAAGVE